MGGVKWSCNIIIVTFGAVLCLISAQQSSSVSVDCRGASEFWSACCMVDINSNDAELQRIDPEDDQYECQQGTHFDYLHYGPYQSYICVTYGCGGTFIITPSGTSSSAVWSSWGAWSSCSANCGMGSITRSRTCSTGMISDCSRDSNDSIESRMCYVRTCRPQASWTAWGNWGACSVTCGSGVQTRTRTCSTGVNRDCSTNVNANTQSMGCVQPACPFRPVTTARPPQQLSCGYAPPLLLASRVFGGAQAKRCQFPWVVNIINTQAGPVCGGSIIDATHILTAAHCVTPDDENADRTNVAVPTSQLKVFSGTPRMPYNENTQTVPGAIERKVAKVTVHQNYGEGTNFHDIAIITLSKPIPFDDCHQPVCLPTSQQSAIGLNGCKAMGWGHTTNTNGKDSDDLMYAGVKVYQPKKCLDTSDYDDFNSQYQVCVGGGGTGACSGDSGNALVCPASNGRYYQYGVVSAGTFGKCGQIPSIFTSVSAHMPWIQSNL